MVNEKNQNFPLERNPRSPDERYETAERLPLGPFAVAWAAPFNPPLSLPVIEPD
jgi:hypothetical protein